MFCPHCGKYVTDSSKDCSYCGRPLDVASAKSNVSPAPAVRQESSYGVAGGYPSTVNSVPYVRKSTNQKKGQAFFSILGIIGGIVSIILGLAVVYYDTGAWEMSNRYGADFYTDVQNSVAQAANNIQCVAEMLNTGISSMLIIFGVAMIAYFGLKFLKNKENN